MPDFWPITSSREVGVIVPNISNIIALRKMDAKI